MNSSIISYPKSLNIGDEIQSLGAKGLISGDVSYIPRDYINDPKYSEKKTKLICNGWFTPTPEQWPPAPNIEPLFVSFHVTNENASKTSLVNSQLFDYYKQFEPIGCRDHQTVDLFKGIGIEAYFSGCLTLTLENKYDYRTEDIYIVDPFYRFTYDKDYRKFCMDKLIPEKYKDKVTFISHKYEDHDVEKRFEYAEGLLKKYATAKMVITSRIHCALPCLALGTPVYFVDVGYSRPAQRVRLKGIVDLFNTINKESFPFSELTPVGRVQRLLKLYKMSDNSTALNIDWENPKPNPTNYLALREKLKERVKNFLV